MLLSIFGGLLATMGLFSIVPLVLTIYCLYDIFQKNTSSMNTKLLWVIIVLIAPVIGGIVYLVIGRDGKSINL